MTLDDDCDVFCFCGCHFNQEFMLQAVMASAASPKRMVSSVFITLASPHRATVTQQQPTLQAHSAPAIDQQHPVVRVSPGDSIPAPRYKKDSASETHSSVYSKDRTHARPLDRASEPSCPKAVQPGLCREKQQDSHRGAAGIHKKSFFNF